MKMQFKVVYFTNAEWVTEAEETIPFDTVEIDIDEELIKNAKTFIDENKSVNSIIINVSNFQFFNYDTLLVGEQIPTIISCQLYVESYINHCIVVIDENTEIEVTCAERKN